MTIAETHAPRTHRGSCHCGAVRFEAELTLENLSKCNCSICLKINGAGAFTKPAEFRLLAGEEALGTYAWGAKTSMRHFCKRCGVHCFGRGHLAELGGDFVSVNANTLDGFDPNTLPFVHWDGRHDNCSTDRSIRRTSSMDVAGRATRTERESDRASHRARLRKAPRSFGRA